MSGASWLGRPEIALLILLITGHVLADFLFQTSPLVERKKEGRALLAHSAIAFLSHATLLLPFVEWVSTQLVRVLVLLALLASLHALIDLAKIRWKSRSGDSPHLFIVDQVAHVLVVVVVWHLWRLWLGEGLEVTPGPLAPDDLAPLSASFVVVSGYVLNGNGAAALIKLFLSRFPIVEQANKDNPQTDIQQMGRTIGILERMLVLSLVILGQWQGVGWVFAGKTVARFRELDNRAFSEYYLIGTLSSLLFAAATGSAVRLLITGTL